MKNKPLIPFPVLEKYKYAYFVISSVFMAFIGILGIKLFLPIIMGTIVSLKYMILQFFINWCLMYPVSFAIFEAVKKQYKKAQEKKTE